MSFVRTVLRRRRLERELEDELQGCLEELVAQKARTGLTPEQARRDARLELEGVEPLKEKIRQGRVGQELVATLRDCRFAVRMFRRSPGFALVAILTLALGIGANVAVFSVMHSVLWRSLPYPDADRLVVIQVDVRGVANAGAAPGEVFDLGERSRLVDSIATINGVDAHVYVDGEYEHVAAASVSDGVLPLLGAAPPALGRTLRGAEDTGEWVRSVVISDDLWRRRFGGDRAAIGRRIQVNNLDVQIVGILRPGVRVFLPPSTFAAEEIDVWFPSDHLARSRESRGYPIIGRLRAGVTLRQAQAELDALAAQFVAEYPAAYPGGALRFSLRPLRDALTADVQPALFALAGAVAFVLLIACVNVANLLIARGQARQRELAVRRSLGASRARIVRQLLAESVLLAAGSAAAGLLVGYIGVELVEWLRPSHLPRQSQIAINGTVVLFTVALSAVTPLVFGVLPSIRLASTPPSMNRGRGDTAGPSGRRLQRALIVLEVALSIVPLVAAGLMLRTFVNLTQAPIGFDPSNIVTAKVPISSRMFPKPEQRVALFRDVLSHVGRLPGVDDVSAANSLPFGPWQATRRYGGDDPSAPLSLGTEQSTMPGYLRVMGIHLREGRDFTDDDLVARRPVVIVDERIARQLWPDGALGKRLTIEVGRRRAAVEVIGVTNAVRMTRVRDEGLPHFFVPYRFYDLSLVIKTRESPAALGPAIKRAAESLGTGRAVFDIRPMSEDVAASIGDTRFTLLVLLGFACATLLLAGVGMYGTLAYLISQRTPELGMRMALGASPSHVIGTVVREALVLAGAGALIGLAGAFATVGVLRGLLYEVRPFDGLTLFLACVTMAAVAVAAAARPAWRAARIDPAQALRSE